MLRIGEQRPLLRQLDDAAQIHDGDAVRDVLDDGKVVGDEQIGHAEVALQIGQQVDHLRLHRDVERGDGLVAHDQLGSQRQGAGDHEALALAAGELVRKADHLVAAQADLFEQRGDLGLDFGFRAAREVLQRLGDDVLGAHARIERRVGVLEDDLQVLAIGTHVGARELRRCARRRGGFRRPSARSA